MLTKAFMISLLSAFVAVPLVSSAQGYLPYGARPFPPGTFRIGGFPFSCQTATTIVVPNLGDLGRASPNGPIYMDASLNSYPLAFIGFVYAHECAHHLGQMNETRADRFAVCIGKRQGWLSPQGLSQVCAATVGTPGSWAHLPGPARCQTMIQAYASC
jgi:hypothetical protein